MDEPKPNDNSLTKITEELQALLKDADIPKIYTFLKANFEALISSDQSTVIVTDVLKTVESTFEKSVTDYKALLMTKEKALSAHKQEISDHEQKITSLMRVLSFLLESVDFFESFNWVIEIALYSQNLKVTRKAIQLVSQFIANQNMAQETLDKYKGQLQRFVHRVSMIVKHLNLHSNETLSLVELLNDDAKFKELNTRMGEKLKTISYNDSLEFSYYITNSSFIKDEAIEKELQEQNDEIKFVVQSINGQFPDESAYAITQKILKEKRLNVEDKSPLFDALQQRVILSQGFKDYKFRLDLVELVVSCAFLLALIYRREQYYVASTKFIVEQAEVEKILDQIINLFHLKVEPRSHKFVLKQLKKCLQNEDGHRFKNFFVSLLSQTGELYLVFKDTSSLEVVQKNSKDIEEHPEEVTIKSNSLILPKESIQDSRLLEQVLGIIQQVYRKYFFESRRKQFIPDVDQLSHLITSILQIFQPSSPRNLFVYSKEALQTAFQTVGMLIYHKEFVRQFNVIDGIIAASENLFQLQNSKVKCFLNNNLKWEPLEDTFRFNILKETITMISSYFVPVGRYASRAEMAPTIARKVAESGIIKHATNYLSNPKEADSELFKILMKLVSEICRESQTLVPRLIEAGIMDMLLKKIEADILINEDFGEALQFIAHLCLQEVGRKVEQKYKIIEKVFDLFTKDEFDELNKKWFNNDLDDKYVRKFAQIDRIDRELVYITKYIPTYSETVLEGMTRVALELLEKSENLIRELTKLEHKEGEVIEAEKDEQYQAFSKKFNFIFYKLHNFCGIYVRFLRDSKIRDNLFKNGGFDIVLKLLSLHQVICPDYKFIQTRQLEYFFQMIDRELERLDLSFSEQINKKLIDEVGIIEKITGPFDKIKSLSDIIGFDFASNIQKDGVLRALYLSKGMAADMAQILRSTCLISILAQCMAEQKLGVIKADKMFDLYSVYNGYIMEYNMNEVEKIKDQDFKEEKEIDETRSKIRTAIEEERDLFSKGNSYLKRIKQVVDICIYGATNSINNPHYKLIPSTILHLLLKLKNLGAPPKDEKELLLWAAKSNIIYLNIERFAQYQSNARHSQTRNPSFIFMLFEEGGYDLIAHKVKEYLAFINEYQLKQAETKKISKFGEVLDGVLYDLGVGVSTAFDSFFFHDHEEKAVGQFKDEKFSGQSLVESSNCVWLHQLKIVQEFYDIMPKVSKDIQSLKKEKAKHLEVELKDKSEEEQTEVKRVAGLVFNTEMLEAFVEVFFDLINRSFSKKLKAGPEVAKKFNPELERIKAELGMMGFDPLGVEYAAKNIPYLNIESMIEWLTSNEEEVTAYVSKAKKGGSASPEKGSKENQAASEELGQLSGNQLVRVKNKEFTEKMIKQLTDSNFKVMNHLSDFKSFEQYVIRFTRKSMVYFKDNSKANISQQIAVIILKMFKNFINSYFKGTKFLSSFKVSKNVGIEAGNELIKSYQLNPNATLLEKLEMLELTIDWFQRVRKFIPSFEKNIVKSDFLPEIMTFFDHFIESIAEINGQLKPDQVEQAHKKIRSISESILKIAVRIVNLRVNQAPQYESFSFERKDKAVSKDNDTSKDKSIDEGDKKSLNTSRSKQSEDAVADKKQLVSKKQEVSSTNIQARIKSQVTEKPLLDVLINIVNISNNLAQQTAPKSTDESENNKNSAALYLLNEQSAHDLFELLQYVLSEGPEKPKHFIQKKGVQELLKLKIYEGKPLNFINDISFILMPMIEESQLITATIEQRIKAYFNPATNKSGQPILLSAFMTHFKNYYQISQKVMVDIVQKLCIIYGKEPELKHSKIKDQLNNRYIKLKPSADVNKYQCLKSAASKSIINTGQDLGDSSDPQPSVINYQPSKQVFQVLNILIETVVQNFFTEVKDAISDQKKKSSDLLFPYHSLIKMLLLISGRYPLLLPSIFSYNCASLIPKDEKLLEKVPILKEFTSKTNFTFLHLYLRVINFVTLDKLRYFLVESSACRDILTLEKAQDKAQISIGSEIGTEIIRELENIFQEELNKADFLDNDQSVQTICAISSLIIAFLPVRHLLKIILHRDNTDTKNKSLLQLYILALKRMRLKNYYKLENVMPFIVEPLSVLIQYQNYIILQELDLDSDEISMPHNVLIKDDYNEICRQRYVMGNEPSREDERRHPRGGAGHGGFPGMPRYNYPGDDEEFEVLARGNRFQNAFSFPFERGSGRFLTRENMHPPLQQREPSNPEDDDDELIEIGQEDDGEDEQSLGSDQEYAEDPNLVEGDNLNYEDVENDLQMHANNNLIQEDNDEVEDEVIQSVDDEPIDDVENDPSEEIPDENLDRIDLDEGIRSHINYIKDRHKAVFASEISSIIKRTYLQDPDLRKISKAFADSGSSIGKIFTQQQSGELYEQANDQNQTQISIYTGIYEHLAQDLVSRGGDSAVDIEGELADGQGPRRFDLSSRSALLRLFEEEVNGNLTRSDMTNLLRRYVDMISVDRDGGSHLDSRFGQLLLQGNPNPREQAPVDQQVVNNFTNDLLQAVECDIPVAENSNQGGLSPDSHASGERVSSDRLRRSNREERANALQSSLGRMFGALDPQSGGNSNRSGGGGGMNAPQTGPAINSTAANLRNTMSSLSQRVTELQSSLANALSELSTQVNMQNNNAGGGGNVAGGGNANAGGNAGSGNNGDSNNNNNNNSNNSNNANESSNSNNASANANANSNESNNNAQNINNNANNNSNEQQQQPANQESQPQPQAQDNSQPEEQKVDNSQNNENKPSESQEESKEPVEQEPSHNEPQEPKPEEEKQQQENPSQEPQASGSDFPFQEYGIDKNFLESYGVDMSIFEMLPEEEKNEFVMGLMEQQNQLYYENQSNNLGGTSNNNANTNSQNNANNSVSIQSNTSNQAQPNAEPNTNNSSQANQPSLSNNSPEVNNNSNVSESQNVQPQPSSENQNAQENNNSQSQPQGSPQQQNAEENKQQENSNPQNNNSNASPQQNNSSNPQPNNDIPGLDPELLANLEGLPPDLRAEILQQQQQLTGNVPAGGQSFLPQNDVDPAQFLAGLDPALRQEILATSDQNFIDGLPENLANEAMMLQEGRVNYRNESDLMPPQRNEPSEPPLNFIEKELKKGKNREQIDIQSRERLYQPDDKFVESLIKLLYLEESKFKKFPFAVLKAISQHPKGEYMIFDTLTFLLRNKQVLKPQSTDKHNDEPFPPQQIIEKNRVITDKDQIYAHVSSNILFILFYLTQNRSNYFVEKVEDLIEQYNMEMPGLQKKKSSLDSINAIRNEAKLRESDPLLDLLSLCKDDTIIKDQNNLISIISIIENVCKNPKMFTNLAEEEPAEEEKKSEQDQNAQQPLKKKEEILICKYKLTEEAIHNLCNILYSENLNTRIISKLSFIIGVFSQEKSNLDMIIKVMKEIMYKVSLESNEFLHQKLKQLKTLKTQALDSDKQRDLLNEVAGKFGNQEPILRIALIIKFLYETTVKYLKDKLNYEKKKKLKQARQQGNKKPDPKSEEPQPKSLKDEIFQKTKEQIINSLESIMLDDNLNMFWINVSELVFLINDSIIGNWDLQNLLNIKVRPIIESFFIIHKIIDDEEYNELRNQPNKMANIKVTLAEFKGDEEDDDNLFADVGISKNIGSMSPTKEQKTTQKMTLDQLFNFICEKNKKVINNMIKQDFNLLNDSMSMVAKKVPKILEFEIRRAYFRKELSKQQRPGSLRLRIKREKLMEGSFGQLFSKTNDEMRRKLNIEFAGEEGIDAGGVAREWFLELSKHIFNPNYNLFIPSANGNTFQPSLISDPENLNYFKFVGKFIAKALFDGYLLECYFTRSFYKHILGQPLNYHDMEDLDPSYYKSLKWTLENDITNAGLDLTFSFEKERFGLTEIEDLIPNGRNIPVTEENKKQYVNLICQAKMASGIKAQIENFLSGFFELIPKNLIAIFDSKELELLISGLPDIDIVDLKENTEYHGYQPDHQVMRWFWEIIENFDHTQKANLLQFVTGTSKVPLEGFKALSGISGLQKFQIHRAGDVNSLPTGHTCFNQLDLPEYKSKDQLKQKLLLAISEGKEGFGFA